MIKIVKKCDCGNRIIISLEGTNRIYEGTAKLVCVDCNKVMDVDLRAIP